MFGFSGRIDDIIDNIHANGGYLKQIVVNIEDRPGLLYTPFADIHERYNEWLAKTHPGLSCEVVHVDQFEPIEEMSCVAGFTGAKASPFIRGVLERFDLHFPPLIHPTAYCAMRSEISDGVVIGANSVVGSMTVVERFVYINNGVTVGHDSILSEFCATGPNCAIASGARIASFSFIGVGASMIEKISIGEGALVAGGASVTRDVPPWTIAAGVPAVVKKKRLGGPASSS